MSIYFGLSAGLQPLHVSRSDLVLESNDVEDCGVFNHLAQTVAGNAYGGGISVYIGGYSAVYREIGNAEAAVGETVVRNVSVVMHNTQFKKCSAKRRGLKLFGASAYGGAFSFYVGGYAWSFSSGGSSVSTCAGTTVSDLTVIVSKAPCSRCVLEIIAIDSTGYGVSSIGGSLSVMHVGGYAWSWSQSTRDGVESSSNCGPTTASRLRVDISNAPCTNCYAMLFSLIRPDLLLKGASSHGGSLSAMYIGAYAWSNGESLAKSISTCKATNASDLSVRVDNTFYNSSLAGIFAPVSYGVSAYGGSISALYIGARAWSYSASQCVSSCETTAASNLTVLVGNVSCVNCFATVESNQSSIGADAFGGAISALFVGGYAWSFDGVIGGGSQISKVGKIHVQNSRVSVISSSFINCSAISYTYGRGSHGSSTVFGGAIAILQLPQVFPGRFNAPESEADATNSNLTVFILRLKFISCKVATYSTTVPEGLAFGGGGAVYANSAALSIFTVQECNFSSCEVDVLSGTSDLVPVQLSNQMGNIQSRREPHIIESTPGSIGGALAVEAGPNSSFVEIQSCSFDACSAQGANAGNLAVLGGAVAVSRVSNVTVNNTNFADCQIIDAIRNSTVGAIVSGGAALSVSLARAINIYNCTFDATNGRDEEWVGLLVLAANSSLLHIDESKFESSATALQFECVDGNGTRSVRCDSLETMFINVTNSNVRQQTIKTNQRQSDQQQLAQLISFGKGVPVSFTNFRMVCLPGFSVFKDSFEKRANVEYSCGKCQIFDISLTGTQVFLDNLSSVDRIQCVPASKSGKLRCPLGVSECTTFLSVAKGFWTRFPNSSNVAFSSLEVSRCPSGYCGCQSQNLFCLLDPPLTIDRKQDQLCNGNRSGKLCGGCRANFTQSGDGKTCISNEECRDSLWWVWTLSILGYACYGLYIAVSCGQFGENAIACVLFYLQISSFVSNTDESGVSNVILEFALAQPLVAVSKACSAPSMTAYNATAFKLISPLFVLSFSMAWTWFLRAFKHRLQQRNIRLNVSYSGTLAASLLFCFSSVAKVVFTLVECTQYDTEGVVFIDGTVACLDTKWKALMFIVVLLCCFPVVFAAALWLNKLPEDARAVVCRNFTEPVFYWGAVTLAFRLLISISQFMGVAFPNLLALIRMFLSVAMLILLVQQRPHILIQTFLVDLVCYVCLIVQFGFQTLFADREYLGVAQLEEQKDFFDALSKLSTAFRFEVTSTAA